ncbi:MAG: hypothetical protein ABI333_24890 [bacterium]
MAVVNNEYIDLASEALTDWQRHGAGAQHDTTLEPDCSFTIHGELSTDKCFLIEAVLSADAAEPDSARLWAKFHKHDATTDLRNAYHVEVRLEVNAPYNRLALYDMLATPAPVAVATVDLNAQTNWTNKEPRVRVRLRLEVDSAGATRTLHLEAEASEADGELQFENAGNTLADSVDVDTLSTEAGSLQELGFGNFGSQRSEWESVHVTVADKGTALPYWPPAIPYDADGALETPGFRVTSPSIGIATVQLNCQNTEDERYLSTDRLTLSMDVQKGSDPADHEYPSVPFGSTVEYDFFGINDEQDITLRVRITDLSGRTTDTSHARHVDHSGPSLKIVRVDPPRVKEGDTVSVEFTANEALNEDTITVTVAGEPAARVGAGTSPYTYRYTARLGDGEGDKDVTVQADDPAGNTGSDTYSAAVVFDFTGPAISIETAPAPLAGHNDRVAVTLNVQDPAHVNESSFDVKIDGAAMDEGSFTLPLYRFTYLTDKARDTEGDKTITITVEDELGNSSSESFPNLVTFDFTGPTVAVETAPAPQVGDGATVSLRLDIRDAPAGVNEGSFEVRIGGELMREGTHRAPIYEFTYLTDKDSDTDGDKTISATVQDTLGNTTADANLATVTFDIRQDPALLRNQISLFAHVPAAGPIVHQHAPNLQLSQPPDSDTPWSWGVAEHITANADFGGVVPTVDIEGYSAAEWGALDDADPLKDLMRLGMLVKVHISDIDPVWQALAAPGAAPEPSFTFEVSFSSAATESAEKHPVTVSLRTLSGVDFLVFDKQHHAGPMTITNATPSGESYRWSVASLSDVDPGFTVSFAHDPTDTNHLGGRIVVEHSAGPWPALGGDVLYGAKDLADASFDLILERDDHTVSAIPCTARLRKLIGAHHLVFPNQVFEDTDEGWLETAITSRAGETVSVTVVDWTDAPLPTQPFTFNGRAGLASVAPATVPHTDPWYEEQQHHLRLVDGANDAVPASYVQGRAFRFRQYAADPLVIQDRLTPDYQAHDLGDLTEDLQIANSSEVWLWSFVQTFGLDSNLDLVDGSINTPLQELTFTWIAGELKPFETGTLATLLHSSDGAANQLSPTVWVEPTIEILRDVGVVVVHGDTATTGDQQLPDAYQSQRWRGDLEALVFDLQDGDTLTWDLVLEPSLAANPALRLALMKTGDLKYDPADPELAANGNAIQTAEHPVARIPEILDAQHGPGYQILVDVTHSRAGKILAGGNQIKLDFPVHRTFSDLDIAVLLDRSGSMAGDRWDAACNGADAFSKLVARANEHTAKHSRVGVYWFWGDADPALPIAGTTGTKLLTPPLDTAFELCQAKPPGHFTALGAGLLHCRDELLAHAELDAGAPTRGRVILVLSDGMENRPPELRQVFFEDPARATDPEGHWSYFQATGAAGKAIHENGPEIRIFPVALPTGGGWADKLRDVAAETGGIWALDAGSIDPSVGLEKSQTLTMAWFCDAFTKLGGYELAAPFEDSPLLPNQLATRTISVSQSQDSVVFYQLASKPEPNAWDFRVKPPGADFWLDKDNAGALPGVTYDCGTMYQMFTVRRPLQIPGHEHRWAGEWEMSLTRAKGAGKGCFGMGGLTHQDLQLEVDVLARPRPRPGEEATLRVRVADNQGNPIRKADVWTEVQTPAPWIGDQVAHRVSADPSLVRKLRSSKSQASRDTGATGDRVLRYMVEHNELQQGGAYIRRLDEVRPGIYEARIELTEPGVYDLHTSLLGRSHQASARQSFNLGATSRVSVTFTPDPARSPSEGFFLDDRTIRLSVTPTDRQGRLLGPSWSERVVFEGPAALMGSWPSTDGSDGRYWVDLELKAKHPRFDRHEPALWADHLLLKHPSGDIRPMGDRLRLLDFSAVALGTRIPITVRALVGNQRLCEVHLATCPHTKQIRPRDRVLFHDLDDASDAGYDTCEECLPLICNMHPGRMEAHLPFCSHGRKVPPQDRLDVANVQEALALGFHGCEACLPHYHK